MSDNEDWLEDGFGHDPEQARRLRDQRTKMGMSFEDFAFTVAQAVEAFNEVGVELRIKRIELGLDEAPEIDFES